MARMSIDDKFLRDPRVTQLALDLGITRWDAMGRLLAVFSTCYDLERDVLQSALIDHAAELAGFADAMFAVDLAVNTRRGLRVRGAGKRIEYLTPKREAGRLGGIKSGESRRKLAKQKRSKREASPNPPDPVPDLPPDPVPEDQNPSPPRAIPPSTEPVAEHRSGQPVHHATQQGAATPDQVSRPAIGNVAELQRAPTPDRSAPATGSVDYNPDDARARGRLAEATYRRISDARVAIAAEFGLAYELPLQPITPGTQPSGFVDLRDRLREEGQLAPAAADRVVENLIKQARAERSVEWLGPKAFGAKAWQHARTATPPARARERAPPGSPTRRKDPAPAPFRPDWERDGAAAALQRVLGTETGATDGPPED